MTTTIYAVAGALNSMDKSGIIRQRLTYSQRRRIINLLWTFVSNSVFPFILGFSIALIITVSTVVETLKGLDKAGLSYCIQPDFQANADITGVVGETSTSPPGTWLPDCKPTETTDSITHTCTEINGIQLLEITSI